MATVGRALLILGLGTAVFGIVCSIYGARTGDRRYVDSGRRSVYALAALMTMAFAILEAAFLRSDFSYNVVAEHSSTTTPTFYKATAAWSSQEGSLLLWVFLLSMWSSLILFATRNRVKQIAPYATAVLLGFATFFTSLATFLANPFTTTGTPPQEGAGLDPLLLHPSMMFHPPMLYSGYTLLAVPFAFAIGALITRRTNTEWIQVTRKFALGAWLCLGIGILLGARWSYTELGWGGYWAWDAVENAALMPWLVCTAFIHSIMIQEKRGMLKVWNAALILLTGTLAILGTFLVRSGILDSIHAFGASTLGIPFVILLATMIAGSIALVISRRDSLKSDHELDSLFSREAVFLFQNLVLVAMAGVIFWVTFFPLISEAITGTKVSVGPPAFRPFVVPLALILVLLSGVGPLIAWRRATVKNLKRNFAVPAAAGVLAYVLIATTTNALTHPFAFIMFGLGTFVIFAVLQELWRGTAARRAATRENHLVALLQLVRRNRRRYGGYIVHLGLAVLLIGVAASSSFQHSKDVSLVPGQSAVVDDYKVSYVTPTASATPQKISLGAVLSVSKNGHHVTTVTTTRGFYPSQDPSNGIVGRFFAGASDSNVGLDAGLTHDIWTVINPDLSRLQPLIDKGDALFGSLMQQMLKLTPAQQQQQLPKLFEARDVAVNGLTRQFIKNPWPAEFLLIVSPLVTWIWLGAIVIACGGLIALVPLPSLARRRAAAAVRAARVAGEVA
jgi:cytochrome c-type biogenesis protein CcmF